MYRVFWHHYLFFINDFKVFKEQYSFNYNNEKPTSIDRGRLHFCLQQVFYFWNFMV